MAQKPAKTRANRRVSEEEIFMQKMFAYALVAMESLPAHRQDKAFLEIAQAVLENYHNPSHLMQFLDLARERIRGRRNVVRLDDHRLFPARKQQTP